MRRMDQLLQSHLPNRFTELALSDSSLRALELASSVVGEDVVRYQTDLLRPTGGIQGQPRHTVPESRLFTLFKTQLH